MREKKSSWLFSIDVIRVLAFVGIFVFHFLDIQRMQNPAVRSECIWGKFSLSYVCVALFFMISGFGLMKGEEEKFSAKEFYLRRLIRILIPYFICNIFYIIFLGIKIRGFPVPRSISVLDLFFWLTGFSAYLNLYGASFFTFGLGEWFLGALILMYLLFPILRIAVNRLKWKFLLIYAAFYIIWVWIYPIPVPIYTDLLAKLLPFILGMYLKICPIKRQSAFAAGSILVLLLSFFPIFVLDKLEIEYFVTIDAAAIFIILLPLNRIVRENQSISKFFHKAAALEYGMFLCHHAVIWETACLFVRGYTKGSAFLIYLVTVITLTILLGWLATAIQKWGQTLRRV